MKTQNTNGRAGSQKGWHLSTCENTVGMQFGYDPSTYHCISVMTHKAVAELDELVGDFMWIHKADAMEGIARAINQQPGGTWIIEYPDPTPEESAKNIAGMARGDYVTVSCCDIKNPPPKRKKRASEKPIPAAVQMDLFEQEAA